jgi:D-alanyl-D-alanine carboxypeptidase (penicillin-binding protein 5/6)
VKVVSKIVLALYLIALLWLILFKFSLNVSLAAHYQTGLNLIPFADASRGNPSEMIANFVVFMPFGLLLGVNLKRSALWRKFAFIFGFSFVVELIQLVFSIGAADVTDVITNSLGGLLGLLLYDLGSRYVHDQKLDRRIVIAGAVLLMLVPSVLFSGRVKFQSAPAAKATLSSDAKAKDLQLDWPAAGQAAVGTVKDGVLARSSDNEDLRPTASMAKVITALAIMDKQPLRIGDEGPTYTLTAKDVANYRAEADRGGSVVPVYEGMKVTQYEAMQMMLIASANNMADTLAEKVFGSREAYVSYAQNMLRREGFSRTVVADASGFDPDTASTPSELVAIGINALSNPVIAEIVAQPLAQIPGVGTIQNTNELLGADGVIGIKTGTTDEAGNCLLFAASYDDKDGQKVTIVGVIMGDSDATSLFADSANLLASTKQGLDLETTPQADVQNVQYGRPSRSLY